MDLKGIALFLGLSYAVCGGLVWAGFNYGLLNFETGTVLHSIIILAIVNLPALFAFLAGQLGRGPVLVALFPMPKIAVLRVVVLVPIVFALFNLAAVALGHTILDWRMGTLINQLQAEGKPIAPEVLAVLPAFLIIAGMLLTIVLGATMVATIVIGQVYAFHIFLLDRLQPLGRVKATIVGGLLWALWWLPLLYERHRFLGTVEREGGMLDAAGQAACALVIAIELTALIRQAYERSGTLSLSLVVLGAFTAHALTGVFSIWGYIFQIENAPYTGTFGLFSAALWLALGLFPGVLLGGKSSDAADLPSNAPEANHA